MPPPAIIEPQTVDFSKLVADRAAIAASNPQSFEFALLDAVVYIDKSVGVIAGFHDIRADAWWARGHIPGRPLFPGVLMIECAAQLTSFYVHHALDFKGFLGFAGVEETRFRAAVIPPARLLLMGKAIKVSVRRTIMQTQGFVDNEMVFESTILGMPL